MELDQMVLPVPRSVGLGTLCGPSWQPCAGDATQPLGKLDYEFAEPEAVIELEFAGLSAEGSQLPEVPSGQSANFYKPRPHSVDSAQLSRTSTFCSQLSPTSTSTVIDRGNGERRPTPRKAHHTRDAVNVRCSDDMRLAQRSCGDHIRLPQRAAKRTNSRDSGGHSDACEAPGHREISRKADGDWFTYSDGSKYSGEWVGASRHGQGVQVWPNGMSYNGQWSRDAAEGQGRFSHSCGDVFEGAFQNNAAHGIGTFRHSDGSSYFGSWVDDEKHGIGEEAWADGTSYRGQYSEGMKSGEGSFMWSDGSSYEGQFLNDQVHGEGGYVFATGMRYQGQWVMKKMHGRGAFVWDDGRTYVGEYVDNLRHGHGIFKWPDGRVYDGEWAFGSQHGNGRYTRASGDKGPGRTVEGTWVEGRRVETENHAVLGREQRSQMAGHMAASSARTRQRSQSTEGIWNAGTSRHALQLVP